MKKTFRKIMKPRKPFEEWAKEHEVELPAYKTESNYKLNKSNLFNWFSAAASLVVFAVIISSFFLFSGKDPSNPDNTEPQKSYSAQDVESKIISLNSLYQIDNLLLFNVDSILEYNSIFIDVPKEDEAIVLSYTLSNCLIISNNEEKGFYIDYKIRIYQNYEFYAYMHYSRLEQSFIVKDTKIYYEIIDESKSEKLAYVKFKYGNFEYFLQVKNFEDLTDINETTLKILLNDLFVL